MSRGAIIAIIIIILLIVLLIVGGLVYYFYYYRVVLYSEPEYKGQSVTLNGSGSYPFRAVCGTPNSKILSFKPKSAKLPIGHKIGIKGFFGNPEDKLDPNKCGPSISWITNNFNNLTAGVGNRWDNWVYDNVDGSIEISKL